MSSVVDMEHKSRCRCALTFTTLSRGPNLLHTSVLIVIKRFPFLYLSRHKDLSVKSIFEERVPALSFISTALHDQQPPIPDEGRRLFGDLLLIYVYRHVLLSKSITIDL